METIKVYGDFDVMNLCYCYLFEGFERKETFEFFQDELSWYGTVSPHAQYNDDHFIEGYIRVNVMEELMHKMNGSAFCFGNSMMFNRLSLRSPCPVIIDITGANLYYEKGLKNERST